MQCVPPSAWLISLNAMTSSSIHAVMNNRRTKLVALGVLVILWLATQGPQCCLLLFVGVVWGAMQNSK